MNAQPWGCHNREIADGYWRSYVGIDVDFPLVQWVWIPHNMSKYCRSDSANDERCSGCKWQRKEVDPAPIDGSGGLNNA